MLNQVTHVTFPSVETAYSKLGWTFYCRYYQFCMLHTATLNHAYTSSNCIQNLVNNYSISNGNWSRKVLLYRSNTEFIKWEPTIVELNGQHPAVSKFRRCKVN